MSICVMNFGDTKLGVDLESGPLFSWFGKKGHAAGVRESDRVAHTERRMQQEGFRMAIQPSR